MRYNRHAPGEHDSANARQQHIVQVLRPLLSNVHKTEAHGLPNGTRARQRRTSPDGAGRRRTRDEGAWKMLKSLGYLGHRVACRGGVGRRVEARKEAG